MTVALRPTMKHTKHLVNVTVHFVRSGQLKGLSGSWISVHPPFDWLPALSESPEGDSGAPLIDV